MTTEQNRGPVATHRDGAVSAKVWRNMTKDGKPFYNLTLQRTYTDSETGKPKESRSFQGADVLKLPNLTNDAYRSIQELRAQDREQQAEQTQGGDAAPDRNMQQQHEQVMQQAAPEQNAPGHDQQQTRPQSRPSPSR